MDTDVPTTPAAEEVVPKGPPTVTIGTHIATLIEPSPLGCAALAREQAELDAMGSAGILALSAAALAMSWPKGRAWPTRSPPRVWRPGVRVEDYGHAIYDDLRLSTRDTVPLRDLRRALYVAQNWCASCLLTESEVQAAQDFSEPPAGG